MKHCRKRSIVRNSCFISQAPIKTGIQVALCTLCFYSNATKDDDIIQASFATDTQNIAFVEDYCLAF